MKKIYVVMDRVDDDNYAVMAFNNELMAEQKVMELEKIEDEKAQVKYDEWLRNNNKVVSDRIKTLCNVTPRYFQEHYYDVSEVEFID